MEESSLRRQPGGGSQEEAVRSSQESPGDIQRRQEAPKKLPGGISRHLGGNGEAPRSVSASVSVSVPILLLLLSVFEGPRNLRAAGQHLRSPR